MKTRIVVMTLATAALASHCSDAYPTCPPVVGIGLVVRVVSNRTDAPICDAAVTALSDKPDIAVALTGHGPCEYIGAHGLGTYSVRAERGGFAPGEVRGVQVASTGGDCPIAERTDVIIRLVPLS